MAASRATTTAPGTHRGTPPASDFDDASRVCGCSAALSGVGPSLVVGAAADAEVDALALGAGVAERRFAAAVAEALAVGNALVDAADVPATEAPFLVEPGLVVPGLVALVGLVGLGFTVGLGLGLGAACTMGAATAGCRRPD